MGATGKAGCANRRRDRIRLFDGWRSRALARNCRTKSRFQALLLLDEAHAVGVIGPNGCGLAAEGKLTADIQMGTLSKALGRRGWIYLRLNFANWMANESGAIFYLFHGASSRGRCCGNCGDRVPTNSGG